MAIREKTISYAFPMTTALVADAVVTNLNQITLYIPEASPTFTSVFVKVGFQDVITATGGTITENRVGLRLGAAAYTTVTETDDFTNTGENIAGVFGPVDFTSHFTSNWTGTSMTCDVQVYFDQSTGTTLGMNNVTVELFISYTYNDTAATQVKTVRIPFDSPNNAIPTIANSDFAGVAGQIPQLTGAGGILPENTPVVRDWYIIIEGNECNNNAATDFTVSAAIDGGAATAFRLQEAGLGSDRYCRWIYKPAVPATTSAHDFELWATLARLNHVTATLVVTYEFTLAGTTRVLNSILLPIEIGSPLGSTTAADKSRFQRELIISDEGTINLRQSAFRINWNCNAGVTTMNFLAGGQANRAYTSSGSVICGTYALQRRVDAGAIGGAGITLARGSNNLTIDGYFTGANNATNITGYLLVNYESDIGSEGIGQNNKTVFRNRFSYDAANNFSNRIATASFSIPETNYSIVSTGFCLLAFQASSAGGFSVDIENQTGEGKGAGYSDIYTDLFLSDAELSCYEVWMRGRDVFKRYPQDADPERVDIETARDYRIFSTTNYGKGLIQFVTYHSHTWAVAGTLSGHNPALATELELIRADTHEVRQRQTLSAGTTAYSFTVYDNTEDYYVSAYQDGTHVGRSNIGQAE